MPAKQKAKQQKQKQQHKKHFLIGSFFVGLGVALGIVGLIFVWAAWLLPYHRAAKIAEATPIRELIISAIDGLNTDAATDPKSGDRYIPEARLYVPVMNDRVDITYTYVPAFENFQEQINVSSKAAVGQKVAMLYAATGMEDMFKKVPELQACSRGFTLVYSPLADQSGFALFYTKQLNNGKTLYVYSEQSGVVCQGFEQLGEALKRIQSY